MRIDKYVTQKYPDISRETVKRMIQNRDVLVNGKSVKPSYSVQTNDRITVKFQREAPKKLFSIPMKLDILYEDSEILVLNKPVGISVHPMSLLDPKPTLIQGVLAHTKGKIASSGAPLRPGIVHRLDKETSGVMVIAKTDDAYASLVQQFKNRMIEKMYLALVEGYLPQKHGIIEAPIGRSMRDRKKMAIFSSRSRMAKTEYKVLKESDDTSLLEIRLHTGRTHQIRVHLSAIGHSVVGDTTYGLQKKHAERMMLHAWKLAFTHPKTKKQFTYEAPVPKKWML